jgi:serine/threonine-protein kinase RsbW
VLRLEIPLALPAIGGALDEVATWMEGQGVAPAIGYRVRLVLDELLANLVMHGRFAGDPPPARLLLSIDGEAVALELEDAAEPFDPRMAPPPPPPSLEEDRVGGMGLALVRKMAEIQGYGRMDGGWNRTVIRVAPPVGV